MRRVFVYRRNINGFYDWLKDIDEFRYIVRSIQLGLVSKDEQITEPRYKEGKELFNIYIKFLSLLNKHEREWVNSYSRRHYPDWNLGAFVNDRRLFTLWENLIFVENDYSVKSITNKEIGDALVNARKERGFSRERVAKIIGISTNTLKMYELGKRTLRFDVYYMLSQFLDISIK